jgi:hypothetical protein
MPLALRMRAAIEIRMSMVLACSDQPRHPETGGPRSSLLPNPWACTVKCVSTVRARITPLRLPIDQCPELALPLDRRPVIMNRITDARGYILFRINMN